MSTTLTSPQVSRYQLWFGMLGGAIAWSVHIVAASLTAEWGCLGGIDRWEYMGITSVAWMILGWSLAMTIIAAVATGIAYGNHRRLSNVKPKGPTDPAETSRFLAYVGMLASGVFLAIILVQSVPILFYLTEC